MPVRKPVVGLCGGIGSGKTRVSEEFRALGCVVIDSDGATHEILQSPEVQSRLRSWWGDEVLDADGRTDRKRIAGIVFSDAEAKRRLESLVHPLIARRRTDMIQRSFQDPTVRAIILDSPLLYETGLDHECDCVVFVAAPDSVRLERLKAQRGWDEAELRKRESWQKPLEEKRRKADYIIENDGPTEALPRRVAGILESIVKKHISV